MRFGLRSTNCNPIGVDFGMHTVKLLQLGQDGEAWRVLAAASKELPDDLPTEDEARRDAVARLISQMLGSAPFKGKRVVSCLPATSVQYKNLRLPKMPPDELRQAVEWEASDRLRLDSGNFKVQYFDAGEVRQGEEVREEVIVLAASTAVVNEHTRLLTQCGLEPVAIDAVPSALARFVEFSQPNDPNAPVHVVLDIGYSSSKVLICRNGRIVFFKLIETGGQKFDEEVAQHLNLSVADAAQLRRRQNEAGQSGTTQTPALDSGKQENVEQAVTTALRASIDELAREVALCLRYYSVTFRGKRPESIALIGGETYQSQLVNMLSDAMSTNVEPVEPFQHIDVAGAADLEATGRSLSEWTVAIGLSMYRAHGARKRGAA